jgi:hypothetical protein
MREVVYRSQITSPDTEVRCGPPGCRPGGGLAPDGEQSIMGIGLEGLRLSAACPSAHRLSP